MSFVQVCLEEEEAAPASAVALTSVQFQCEGQIQSPSLNYGEKLILPLNSDFSYLKLITLIRDMAKTKPTFINCLVVQHIT